MPVGLRLKFVEATEEQYEVTQRHMNIEHDPPKGLIFHSAGPVDGGWGVTDFWESRDAFDRFVAERLRPAVQELGSQAPPNEPDIEEFAVHNITKPWLLQWGSFALSASSPASARARDGLAWLSSLLSRSPTEVNGSSEARHAEPPETEEERPGEDGVGPEERSVGDGAAHGDHHADAGPRA